MLLSTEGLQLQELTFPAISILWLTDYLINSINTYSNGDWQRKIDISGQQIDQTYSIWQRIDIRA